MISLSDISPRNGAWISKSNHGHTSEIVKVGIVPHRNTGYGCYCLIPWIHDDSYTFLALGYRVL